MRADAPVFVTVDAPRTAKSPAVPRVVVTVSSVRGFQEFDLDCHRPCKERCVRSVERFYVSEVFRIANRFYAGTR